MEPNEQEEAVAADEEMPAEGAAPDDEAAVGEQPAVEAPPAANDDSKNAYDAVMAVVDTLLYKDEKVSDAVMQSIAQQPFERSVGQAAAQVIKMIDEQFENRLPDDVIIPATCDTAEKIAEMGESAGLFEITGDFVQKTIGFATAAAGELYGVSPEELQQQAEAAEAAPAEQAPAPAPAGSGLMDVANV